MRLAIVPFLLALSLAAFAADDTPKLPRDAQAAMDAYSKAVAKIDDDAQHRKLTEREKCYTALDKAKTEAAKRGDADAILAIKTQMDKMVAEANAGDKSDPAGTPKSGEKPSPASPIVGAWHVTRDDGHNATWTFNTDHTIDCTEANGHRFSGMWTPGDDGNVKIVWGGNPQLWELFHPPFTGDAMTGDGWNVGKNAVHAKRLDFTPIVGTWTIAYSNSTTRDYIIDRSGTLTFAGTATPIGFTPDGSGYLVRFADAKLERWTLKGGHLNVEHWNPATGYPASAATCTGTGTKK